jgi:glycosyltransferase involved in cell wall biosynthesis
MRQVSSLSLLIPCYNEEHRLAATVGTVTAWIRGRDMPCRLVLVDDGSFDGTGRLIADAARAHPCVVPVALPVNRGKGAALARGVEAVDTDTVVFFDADLAYPLSAIDDALAELSAGADVVIGGRDLAATGAGPADSPVRRLAHAAFAWVVERYVPLGIPDTQCGFKAFRTPAAKAVFRCLTVDRFAFDVELLFLVRRWGLSLKRIPVTATTHGGSSVRLVRDSIEMWRELARIRRRAAEGRYPASLPAP